MRRQCEFCDDEAVSIMALKYNQEGKQVRLCEKCLSTAERMHGERAVFTTIGPSKPARCVSPSGTHQYFPSKDPGEKFERCCFCFQVKPDPKNPLEPAKPAPANPHLEECRDCKFFRPQNLYVGNCHRYPPATVIGQPAFAPVPSIVSVWPNTQTTGWCGEWQLLDSATLDRVCYYKDCEHRTGCNGPSPLPHCKLAQEWETEGEK